MSPQRHCNDAEARRHRREDRLVGTPRVSRPGRSTTLGTLKPPSLQYDIVNPLPSASTGTSRTLRLLA